MTRKLLILGVVVLAVCLVGTTALAGKGGIASYQFPLEPFGADNGQWGMVTLVGLGPDCPDCPYEYQLVLTAKNLDPDTEYILGFDSRIPGTEAYPNNGGNLTIIYRFCCEDLGSRGINLGMSSGGVVLSTGEIDVFCETCPPD